ncbi:MAG: ATP-dependent 6-phosphofructokinase [Spirochaetes bacterium]|nr:ATP-dependent 6-phosphofructokinase [Spirochaetota bacterium]
MTEPNIGAEDLEIARLDFSIDRVGEPTLPSPLRDVPFVDDGGRVCYFHDTGRILALREAGLPIPGFVQAGPREKIYFDPKWTRAAIVTCGGLCPGLNDVIKGVVNTLWYTYGIDKIFGIRYGYRGLEPRYGLEPVVLDPDVVDTIHEDGGTILGSSRGNQDVESMVNTLDRLGIHVLFAIGGDGTQRGAGEIARKVKERGLRLVVVGIPKTIDNDLNFTERTFGFETAVGASSPVIGCAHQEAKGAWNGVGLVKLMGRDSGFIAASATLVNSVVNFCLVPEVPFPLEGERGFLPALARRLERKHHAVVVVAEGAGQDLLTAGTRGKDASGNLLHEDIGVFLRDEIGRYLKARGVEHSTKYFDPSYLIRSVPAQGTDPIFCLHLAQNAVHAALAGFSNLVVGYWHGEFTYIPIPLAIRSRRKIRPEEQLWQSVLTATRQENWLADL